MPDEVARLNKIINDARNLLQRVIDGDEDTNDMTSPWMREVHAWLNQFPDSEDDAANEMSSPDDEDDD
jgi:hypothetical protein